MGFFRTSTPGRSASCKDTYNGVPDDNTLDKLRRRVDKLVQTTEVVVEAAVEITFEEEED
jgi:hypothetical protein